MKTLEQVFGKAARQQSLPPFQLPTQSKTVLIYRSDHSFKGQATYWQRNSKWELIGATRSVNKWLYEVPFSQVESTLKERKLPFKWVDSPTSFSIQPRPAARSAVGRSLKHVHAHAEPLAGCRQAGSR